jgi:hypothetical protein
LHTDIEKQLHESHASIESAHKQRRKILCKDQPFTLLAYFYWAQVKAAMGQEEQAERMIKEVISDAGVNVGEEHTAVLSAKTHHARVLVKLDDVRQKRYSYLDPQANNIAELLMRMAITQMELQRCGFWP